MALIFHVCKYWQLVNPTLVAQHATSQIYRAHIPSENMDVVVKLGSDVLSLARESLALRAYGGHGAARIFDFDDARGALLVESIVPGKRLSALLPDHDEQAVRIAAVVIKRLHQNAQAIETLPTLTDWFQDFTNAPPNLPTKKALLLAKQLIASAKSKILLHGDLHHDNILKSDERGYLAIDPKGVIGDPDYEAAPFLCHPLKALMEHNDVRELWYKRARLFSTLLRVPEQRLLSWSFVHAVAGACFAHEDGIDSTPWQNLAKIFSEALP